MYLQLSPASVVTLIGFGEAGETFARASIALGNAPQDDGSARCAQPGTIRGFDLLAERGEAMNALGVTMAQSADEALAGAVLVLSLVTADAALAAARAYAPLLSPEALWCDMNSIAPQSKQAAARAVRAAGGRYVDVAVMAPVQPAALAVPLLVAGPDAGEAAARLAQLGFTTITKVGENVGQAAAIKLCRSVMVKGMEALIAEMALAAHREGVLEPVLASLDASETGASWAERADYALDRMLVHGARRSAEMHEASAMLRALGLPSPLAKASADWQARLAALAASQASPPEGLGAKLAMIAPALLSDKDITEK